jgi:two-component system, response regulator YesN
MLKVLIVDDEPIVREGLKNVIEWQDYGYEICGEGIDGRDGLDKIMNLNPDLVLMDIKMPGMHGIEVIKIAKEAGYKGKCIILTGYSDFEYAQSSIRLGINSYLLKPIDEDELIDTVKKLYQDIEEERKLKDQITNGRKYIKEAAINSIMNGVAELDSLQEDINSCELNLLFDSFQAAKIDYSINYAAESASLALHVEGFFQDYNNIDIISKDNGTVLLFKGTSNLEAERLLERLYKNLSAKLSGDINIALGRLVNSINKVQLSYVDCKAQLNRRFFYDKNIIIWQDTSKESQNDFNSTSLQKYIEDLYTYIEVSDFEKIEAKLKRLEIDFINSSYTPEKIKGICVNIVAELKDKIVSNYDSIKDLSSSVEDIIQAIYDKSTLKGLIDYIKQQFKEISNKICNDSADNIMKRILNYIEKNYNKDIKLESLAEIFNYNSAYLGKMFKNYTGENFNSHIDRIRIENAKALLSNKELKVYQVSEKVGYKNIDYFYGKFKKHVGISPKEFKKQFGVSSDILGL